MMLEESFHVEYMRRSRQVGICAALLGVHTLVSRVHPSSAPRMMQIARAGVLAWVYTEVADRVALRWALLSLTGYTNSVIGGHMRTCLHKVNDRHPLLLAYEQNRQVLPAPETFEWQLRRARTDARGHPERARLIEDLVRLSAAERARSL